MSITAWNDINWSLTDKRILRYQTRIYKATKDGNISKVKCLQKRLLKSLDAKLVSVRRVTTLNKGKNTPGVDRQIYVTDIEKIDFEKTKVLDLLLKFFIDCAATTNLSEESTTKNTTNLNFH